MRFNQEILFPVLPLQPTLIGTDYVINMNSGNAVVILSGVEE